MVLNENLVQGKKTKEEGMLSDKEKTEKFTRIMEKLRTERGGDHSKNTLLEILFGLGIIDEDGNPVEDCETRLPRIIKTPSIKNQEA